MKKILSFILAAMMLISAAGCAVEDETETPDNDLIVEEENIEPYTEADTEYSYNGYVTEAIESEVETTEEYIYTEDTEPEVETTEEYIYTEDTGYANADLMVWIPTNGGTKYHANAECSDMTDPIEVTLTEAESRGFTFCKKCYN